jgi:predicted permease
MTDRQPPRTGRLFRALLRVFPFDFRNDFGRDMEQTFREQRSAAHREGSMTALVRLWLETFRDVFTTAPREHLDILRQDVGYALRALRRSPIFSGTATLTLGIGVSAAVAVFAIVNGFLLRPLAVEHPEALVSMSTRDSHAPVPHGVSFRDLQDYRAGSRVFEDLLGYAPRPVALDAGQGAERVTLAMVTDNYFSLLGLRPAFGRLILPDEGRARGDAPVLVLTHDYWQVRFRGDRSIVGRTVRLNGRPFTIIGIAPRGFNGTETLVRVLAFAPLWMVDDVMNTPGTSILERRDAHQLTVLGRLKPGVSVDQARAAVQITAETLSKQYPSTNKDMSLFVVPETRARPNPGLGSVFRVMASAMAGLAGLLLLITSANVANLLLGRAAGRAREVALRAAMGARLGRIVRQLFTESVVLALLGSAVALPLVVVAMRELERLISRLTSLANLQPDFSLDLRVIGVTMGVAIVSGVLCGLAPAFYAFRSDLSGVLKTGGRGAAGGSRSRLRAALVVAQVALSLALLVSGGLFVRSLERARDIDLGIRPEGMFLGSASLATEAYDSPKRLAFYERVRDSLAGVPGVERAAWISWAPFAIVYQTANPLPEGRVVDPDRQPPRAYSASIDGEYFVTAGVPLLDGRAFDRRDRAASAPVAIVNQTLVRQFWPGQSAVGRRLQIEGNTVTVVGVVGDGRYNQVWEQPSAMIFRPLAQNVPTSATVAVRTTRAPSEMAAAVREAIRRVDPDVAPYDVRPMREHLDMGNAFFPFRIGAFVTGLFGSVGLLLASIGLYGMVAYHVSQRTQEIGVRMALGARSGDIIKGVLFDGGRIAVIGIAVGAVLAAVVARLLKALLLDVSPFDPLTYGAVSALLMLIALVASFVPARRATRVDPVAALRAD